MKTKLSFLIVMMVLSNAVCTTLNAENYANCTKTELTLDNGIVKRIIKLPSPESGFVTTSYSPLDGDYKYFVKSITDFQFEVNDVVYSGTGKWTLDGIQSINDQKGGNGASVKMTSGDRKVELIVKYLLYPDNPAVRKSLIVKNLTEKAVRLESVDVEKFEVINFYPVTFSWIYHDYGRRRVIGPFLGGKQDALVILHNMNWEQGLVIGNEASGVIKHAEGNWLSNFPGDVGEKTGLRVRNMAWWRSPAMPATTLVLGNPQMQDKDWEMHIKSLAGALPIMLGDPRLLSETDLKKYREYADWLQQMETRYEIMSFRQDLPGYGEPMEGMWDGFQRINTETKAGGIIGIFRHGAVETNRIVTVKYLDPLKTYEVKTMSGNIIATLSGEKLQKEGFTVKLEELYSGELMEISLK